MRSDPATPTFALGAACAIFDGDGRVLLVRHGYGRHNWELPGGGAEPGETPDATALRELREETGLAGRSPRLTGLYLEVEHKRGPFLHLVFRCDVTGDPIAHPPEIEDAGWWRLDALPRPMSDFTERRIADARLDGPAVVAAVTRRRWHVPGADEG